jgi:hypothetical protein
MRVLVSLAVFLFLTALVDVRWTTESAAASAGPDAPPSTLLCSTAASDRTRPFLVGEKRAYFTNIQDGDVVHSPFRVAFAVAGMGVAPAKAGLIDGTGHHHILIDLPLPADIKAPIPFDAPNEHQHQHYKHFGGGETETTLDLPPGKHTLRLLFANALHVPYYISSQVVTVDVLPPAKSVS